MHGKSRSKDGKTIKISLVIRQIQQDLLDRAEQDQEGENESSGSNLSNSGSGDDAVDAAACNLLFPVYELIDPINTSFVDQSPYIAREVALAPVYRGGHIFVPTMLDTLLCQSFFNPQITNILEVLLTSLTQIHLSDDKEIRVKILSKEGFTYGQLFKGLLQKSTIMVALYSGEKIDEDNETTDNMSFAMKLRNVGRRLMASNQAERKGSNSSAAGSLVSPTEEEDAMFSSPCLFTNPDMDRKLRLQDVALVIAPPSDFNDSWGVY